MTMNRRTVLAGAASVVTLAGCGKAGTGGTGPGVDKAPDGKTLANSGFVDLTGQISQLKNKEVKAGELLNETIDRIEALNSKLGAILTKCYDRARETLKTLPETSVAHGAPMLIKDLKDVKGVRTTYGMGAFKNFIATESEAYVKRVEKAGFAILGKTNTPELGLLPVTEPLAYRKAHNPWDLTRTTGGSSGGAAAAVAGGILPCAQGSDGGGSIRIPSHYCGLFGLKPSRGRVVKIPQRAFPIAVSGALSKTVRDNALMLSLTENSGPDMPYKPIGLVTDPINRPLKIGFAMHDYFQGKNICDQDVTDALAKTAKLCESLGHHVEEATPPTFGQEMVDAFMQLWSSVPHEVIGLVEKMTGHKVTDAQVEPWTQIMAEGYVKNGGAPALAKAVVKLKEGEKQVQGFLAGYDVVLCPVMPTPAHKLGKYNTADRSAYTAGLDTAVHAVGYTAIQNVSGAAAMSVPLFRSPSNLPIGSQFVASPGKDDLLLRLAYQLEAARPWIGAYPVL